MFTSVESGKPPSPPTYVYIVNTPTRNSATDRYYIISRTAITIYSSTIMKFPSLSIENSNIPKTNCLPITRRRKEKRTIYFHLRFDVSLNDAIDPTGERGGGRGIRGSQASRWRGEERWEASRFFYGRPDGEIRKGGEPRMRIVGHASRMEKEIERRSR